MPLRITHSGWDISNLDNYMKDNYIQHNPTAPSADAAIIGEVIAEEPGRVVMETEIGTQALLPQPGGELLPRIC